MDSIRQNIAKAGAELKERLDSSVTISVNETNVTIVNEQFNWMQMQTIDRICHEFQLTKTLTILHKRIHTSIGITLTDLSMHLTTVQRDTDNVHFGLTL